jgi:pimeloyl-ACP methyl ester carboxylesterase
MALWVPERNVVDLARRAVSKRSLSTADLKPILEYLRSIDRCTPTGQIVPYEDRCRRTALLNAREVIMSTSRSTAVFKAHYDGIVAFSQTDFTEDLKKINVPALVMHGDDDQIVPYAGSGQLSAKLLKNGTLKTYKGFPHGMPTTHADTINADLLAFIRG